MINIVLFGPPGAGKGTQSEKLIAKYGFIHLSTGDIFRRNIKEATDLGQLAKSYMDHGQLVPDSVTISMLQSEVAKNNNAKGFIFDGFPRNANQANALDEFLKTNGTSITKMIALEVPEDELRIRLLERGKTSGRADDIDPAVIQKRIDVYNNETSPVKHFYLNQNKYSGINGVGSIDSIFNLIGEVIDSLNTINIETKTENNKIIPVKKVKNLSAKLSNQKSKTKEKKIAVAVKKTTTRKKKVGVKTEKNKTTKKVDITTKIKKEKKNKGTTTTKKIKKVSKRGRPAAPKKRGRPQIIKRGRPTAPKKRGRPEVKKRGRPVTPKRRGRPEVKKRGRPSIPKKRGRPEVKKRGRPSLPKKRGRPEIKKRGRPVLAKRKKKVTVISTKANAIKKAIKAPKKITKAKNLVAKKKVAIKKKQVKKVSKKNNKRRKK